MEKQKNIPPYRAHYIICVLIAILIFTSLRYPIVFFDRWYDLTRSFYFAVSVAVIVYGIWLFRRLRMRYVAAILISIALVIGAVNIFRFSLPFEAECDQYPPIRRVCFMGWVEYDSLTYAHWNEVTFFYTVGDLPVGIWYRSRHLE